jgi:hypothetical protein
LAAGSQASAKVAEAEALPHPDEDAGAPPRAPAEPILARIEVELADGRYLLAYSHLAEAPADA